MKLSVLKVKIQGSICTYLQKNNEGYGYHRVSSKSLPAPYDRYRLTNETSTISMFKEYTNLLTEYLGPSQILEAGEYVYPFHFRYRCSIAGSRDLIIYYRVPPTNLPATFKSPFGYVKYELVAVVKKHRHESKTVSKEISVPSTRDATDSDLAQPLKVDVKGHTRSFFSGWRKTGYFIAKASLEKSGFTSGMC